MVPPPARAALVSLQPGERSAAGGGPRHGGAGARLTELVRRHETLRTVFAEVDGRPVAGDPAARRPIDLPAIDLPALGAAAPDPGRRATVPSIWRAGRCCGPLLLKTGERGACAAPGDAPHRLGRLVDGAAAGRADGAVRGLRRAAAPRRLPELPVQYADFAVWQRRWLAGEELARQIDYWQRQLAGAPPLLELPADRPRPAVQSFRGGRHRLSLPAELARSLEALGRREGLTPFMPLLAAFQALLGRYTSQGDLVVGTPIANRTRTEIERLIGFFANTLVLRADLSDDPAFLELARRVRGSALGAYAHQDLPFEKLVEELRPERHLSYPPVFQVMFILQNAPAPEVDLAEPESAATGGRPRPGAVRPDADAGRSRKASWTGWLEYGADLFDAATVARWAGHLEALLRGIVEGPERRVSELPLLTAAERRELLAGWNDTAVSWPRETLLHELFERQAAASARGLGGGLRRGAADLRRAGGAVEPSRPPPAPAGRGAGGAGGALRRALGGDGGGAARHPQGGRRLRAARPVAPGGAAGPGARGQRRAGAGDRGGSARPCCRRTRRGWSAWTGTARPSRGESAEPLERARGRRRASPT